jgi:hypothetical protein
MYTPPHLNSRIVNDGIFDYSDNDRHRDNPDIGNLRMTARIIEFRDYENPRDLAPMHGDNETSLAKPNQMAAEVISALMIDTAREQAAEAAPTEDTAWRNIRGNVCNGTITFGNSAGDFVQAYVGVVISDDMITFGEGDGAVPGTIGVVTIKDFDPSTDLINIASTLTNLALLTTTLLSDVHGNDVTTVDNSVDTIILTGVSAPSPHASDFVFV